jgi:hypothetical protein
VELSRRQRAAASCVAMVVTTGFAFIYYHFGHRLDALEVEVSCAVIYSIWASLGKDDGE